MEKDSIHVFATDYESCEGLMCVVEEDEMLYDIKKLLGDYYYATFGIDGKSLNIYFNMGKKFMVTVKEIKTAV